MLLDVSPVQGWGGQGCEGVLSSSHPASRKASEGPTSNSGDGMTLRAVLGLTRPQPLALLGRRGHVGASTPLADTRPEEGIC